MGIAMFASLFIALGVLAQTDMNVNETNDTGVMQEQDTDNNTNTNDNTLPSGAPRTGFGY